ncbi:LysR family transcriptional regulator [Nonomuraea sp. NPDC050153]|uniref:LysR family transcriptional regulator n=1 Tax=Nonomuraea sp. NPDC050153 TaxID=3364359 RepID=UPI0037898680
MDFRQLERFLAVVDHGGFHRAAEVLYVAQPSLSQSIKQLEREMGDALFHRVGRGVVLTEAGRELVGPARMAVHALGLAVESVLPNTEHYRPTLELIGYGIPLLVEKPLVFDLDEADRLLAEAGDLFFAINFNHRYAGPVVRARRDISDGRLGRLSFATWRFGGEGGSAHHPYANLIETQCHGIDMLEHLLGPIDVISAEMTAGRLTLAVAAHFAGGAVGSLVGSYDSSYAYPRTHHVEVNGDAGRLLIDDTVRQYELSAAGAEARTVWEAGYFNDRARSFHETFDAHLDALVPALRAGAPPPVHAAAGRRALLVAYKIIEAFETGRRVVVPPG